MPILNGLKILVLSNWLLYYKKRHQNNVFSVSKLSFKPFFSKKKNIPKFSGKTVIDNILFISKAMNNMLPPIFKNWFQFCYNIHHYSTTFSIKGHLHKKSFRTNNFGKFSVTVSAIDSWNKIQDQMGEIALKDLRPSKIKWLLTNKFIKSYWLMYFYFYRILFILCEYIIGIVLFYLYDSTIQLLAGNWI